jgi:peptidoglycan/xylan/chitin deacetylase (PgdA/CDA1 family)
MKLIICFVICLVTLSNAQYQNGGEELFKRKKIKWPDGNEVALSLSFDDARPSQLDNGMPILDRYEVKATFYVSLEAMQKRKKDWAMAVSKGHEIANHSLNHPCSGNFTWFRKKPLEKYSLEEMREELTKANDTIENILGIRPKTFAYPCGQKFVGRGQDLQSYVPLVADIFLAGRGWLDESSNDPVFCDLAQLMGTEMDGLSFEQVKFLIEEAKKNKHWLVFAGHDIGEAGRQTVLSNTLELLCEFTSDPKNKIWIDTIENISEYVNNYRKDQQMIFD